LLPEYDTARTENTFGIGSGASASGANTGTTNSNFATVREQPLNGDLSPIMVNCSPNKSFDHEQQQKILSSSAAAAD